MSTVKKQGLEGQPVLSAGRVVVVGAGVSGLWSSLALASMGAEVILTDQAPESRLDPEMLQKVKQKGVILEAGGHKLATILAADLVVVSPGIPLEIDVLKKAREKGIEIIGELELASRFIHEPIIAVTGTNGKTTVTSMVGEMLKRAGKSVFVGGNIGTPLSAYVAAQQDGPFAPKADYVVAEVSSFQLETVKEFSPKVAVILNIARDHLDRHCSFEAYVEAKYRILKNLGLGHCAVLNLPSLPKPVPVPRGALILSYGLDSHREPSAWIEGGKIRVRLSGSKAYGFSYADFALPGLHNLENLMAAILASLHLGVEPQVIQGVISEFKPLHHRLEYVAEFRGIRFYNDSKATNVDAAQRALEGFESPVVLIAGGLDKGADFEPLKEACAGKVKGVVLLGEAREKLKAELSQVVKSVDAASMEEAVRKAFHMAQSGDVVLLSPACASFDMFSNYQERGEAFKEAVKALGHE